MKPAVFDLVLTLCIASYLGLVYLAIWKSGHIVSLVASMTTTTNSNLTSSPSKINGSAYNGASNGNGHNNHLKVK